MDASGSAFASNPYNVLFGLLGTEKLDIDVLVNDAEDARPAELLFLAASHDAEAVFHQIREAVDDSRDLVGIAEAAQAVRQLVVIGQLNALRVDEQKLRLVRGEPQKTPNDSSKGYGFTAAGRATDEKMRLTSGIELPFVRADFRCCVEFHCLTLLSFVRAWDRLRLHYSPDGLPSASVQ